MITIKSWYENLLPTEKDAFNYIKGGYFGFGDTVHLEENAFISGVEWANEFTKNNLTNSSPIFKELADKQEEYIAFLGDYIASIASFLHTHNMDADQSIINKGIRLRNEINQLKEKITAKS